MTDISILGEAVADEIKKLIKDEYEIQNAITKDEITEMVRTLKPIIENTVVKHNKIHIIAFIDALITTSQNFIEALSHDEKEPS